MGANVRLKNRLSEDVVYEGIETVTLDTDVEGVQAVFTLGEAATKTVDLDFSHGQEINTVTPNSGTLLTEVTINKPATLRPENIAENVVIAGVTGSFQGGTDQIPKLNAVTATRNGGNLVISNPSTNGNFVTNYKIYDGDVPKDVSNSTTYALTGLGHGTFDVQACASNPKFLDSNKSAPITVTNYSVEKDFTNLLSSDNVELVSNGLKYDFNIVPGAGYFMPEDIEVTMSGQPVEHEWNNYSGHIAFNSVDGDIVISATALSSNRLRRPKVHIEGEQLFVDPPRFATETAIFVDDVEKWTYTDPDTITINAVSGATYGFAFNSNGYYESQNKGRSNSYSLCRVDFNFAEARQVVFHCINSAYLGNCFGLISQVDQTLSTGYSSDGNTGTTKVLRNFSDTNSYSDVDIKVDIPAGQHFIYVKYRKSSSTVTGNDSLQFYVTM